MASSSITIKAKAGRGGKLFGSVSTSDISDAITRQTGAMVDRRNLTVSEPIKQLGSFSVTAHLIGDIDAAFLLNVVAQ